MQQNYKEFGADGIAQWLEGLWVVSTRRLGEIEGGPDGWGMALQLFYQNCYKAPPGIQSIFVQIKQIIIFLLPVQVKRIIILFLLFKYVYSFRYRIYSHNHIICIY